MHNTIEHCSMLRSCSPTHKAYFLGCKLLKIRNPRQQLPPDQPRCIFTAPQHLLTGCSMTTRLRASRDDDSSNTEAGSTDSTPTSSPQSWSLMGRVVSSDRLVLGQGGRQRLVLLAAAKHAGVIPEVMTQRMQELLTLMPDLSSLLLVLNPTTLAALAADTAAVAHKLIQLRLLFPTADVSQMISRRPTLLLDEEFQQVEVAKVKLMARLGKVVTLTPQQQQQQQQQQLQGASSTPTSNFTMDGGSTSSTSGQTELPDAQQQSLNILGTSGGSTPIGSSSSGGGGSPGSVVAVIDGLVSRQPLLLVANVDELLDELERLLPGVDVGGVLLRDPDVVLSVMDNRPLSLW